MTWHVQYRQGTIDHIPRFPSPERAIEAACRLTDDGYIVYGVGVGPLTASIGEDEFARIYDMWSRAEVPLGRSPERPFVDRRGQRRARERPRRAARPGGQP